MPQNLVQPIITALIALIGIIVAIFAIPGVLPAGVAPAGSDQVSSTLSVPSEGSVPSATATGIRPSEPSVPAPPAVLPSEVFNATNAYRRSLGLSELKMHGDLANLAQSWSNTMAKEDHLYHRPNFASHYPEGWNSAAENVLQNYSTASAQDIVRQWHNSPAHRENMQNPNFTHMGVGVAISSTGKLYATQNFAQY